MERYHSPSPLGGGYVFERPLQPRPRHPHLKLRYQDYRTALLEGLAFPHPAAALYHFNEAGGRRGLSSAPADCVALLGLGTECGS